MALSPILFNGTIQATQDVSMLKMHDDSHAAILQDNSFHKVEEEQDHKVHSVREADDTELNEKGYNASEKGDNEYTGDGGRNRRRNREGRVVVKGKGGFDISV